MRKDFVSGVLSEEELGQQLFVHELHRDYAASVLNFRSYDAISRDVLQVRESSCWRACNSGGSCQASQRFGAKTFFGCGRHLNDSRCMRLWSTS